MEQAAVIVKLAMSKITNQNGYVKLMQYIFQKKGETAKREKARNSIASC